MESREKDATPKSGGVWAQRAWLSWGWRTWSRIGLSRALHAGRSWLSGSVAAAGSWRKRREVTGERRGVGGVLAAGLICLAAVMAVAVWPAVVTGLGQASRAVSTAVSWPQPARVAASTQPSSAASHAPTHQPTTAPTSPPVTDAGSPGAPAPEPAPQAPPLLYQRPAPQQPPVSQPPVQSPPTQTPPPQTPPGTRVVQTSTTGWNYVNHGGYPNFTGTMVWTTNSGATATWSTDVTSSNVTVQVWIPNWMGGAVVSYTVTGAQQYSPVQITQEWVSGWQTLGTFASKGTISVVMRYVAVGHPQATPDPACINSTQCTAMAAAQMQFSWS